MMRRISVLWGWLIVVSLLLTGPALAAPNLVNYQGTLVDAAGLPVTASVQVEFALFAADTDPSALWSEQHSVTPQNGAYAVLLGSVTPFPAGLFLSDELWLQLTVAGEVLLPRQRLASVPYAVSARSAGCNPGDFVLCYGGDPAAVDVGTCRAGKRFCLPDGSGYGNCVGTVLPAIEICNAFDDDCNGVVDDAADAPTWYRDSDADGFGDLQSAQESCAQPAGFIASAGDCLDSDAAVKPGAQEFCNSADDDCDGQIDDSCLRAPACSASEKTIVISCSAQYSYDMTSVLNCINSYGTVNQLCTNALFGLAICGQQIGGVCGYLNETSEACYQQSCPSQYQAAFVGRPPECSYGATRPCGTDTGACQAGTESCVNGAWSGTCDGAVEPQPEICGNGLDENCDGLADNSDMVYCLDADGDGFGTMTPENCTTDCSTLPFPPPGYVDTAYADCNDADPSIYVGGGELCDGKDNNCDGQTDYITEWNSPLNPLQMGVCINSRMVCGGFSGWHESYAAVESYEAVEASCDGLDNDCDGETDEGCYSPIGFPCTADGQCDSGYCTDGVCCFTRCDGPAESCAVDVGSLGLCKPL